jgi:hypothetical protein
MTEITQAIPELQRIEQDHMPEVVDNDMAMKRLESMRLDESLRSPVQRRVFFAKVSRADSKRAFGYINSVMRRTPVTYDYEDD